MQLHSWRASQSPGGASHFSTWTSRGWIGMKLDFIHKMFLNCPNHQVFEVCLGLCHPRSLLCHSRSKVCYKSSNSACIIIMTNVACCGVEDDYDTEDADADKEAELLIKPNQIKSVRLCWQTRGGDVWRMLWRGDNSHRSVADTFSQIFTILSHVFSRIYSLAHTYQTQAHTYKTHTTYKKLTQTSTDTNYQFYFQCDWVWLFLKYTLWLIQRHKHT